MKRFSARKYPEGIPNAAVEQLIVNQHPIFSTSQRLPFSVLLRHGSASTEPVTRTTAGGLALIKIFGGAAATAAAHVRYDGATHVKKIIFHQVFLRETSIVTGLNGGLGHAIAATSC